MNLAKLVVLSRKIHRLTVWFMLVLGGLMLATGTTMLYPKIFFFIPPGSPNRVHILVAPWFAAAFLVMILTGSVMYFYPTLQKWLRKPSPPPTSN